MRITDKMLQRNYLSSLSQISERTYNAQQQVLTGKKLSKPSDNPVNAMNALSIRSRLSTFEQYQKNIDNSTKNLETTNTAIDQMSNIFEELSSLAIKGNTEVQTESDNQTIITEANQLIDEMFNIANTKSDSGYIFAGTKTDSKPYQAQRNADGEITKITTTGSSGDILNLIGDNMKIKVNVSGEDFFEKDINLFDTAISLRDNLVSKNASGLENDITNLNDATDKIYNLESIVGSRLNRVESAGARVENDNMNYTQFLSEIEDIDPSVAIMNYQMELDILQNTLSAGSKVFQPRLIDFLQ